MIYYFELSLGGLPRIIMLICTTLWFVIKMMVYTLRISSIQPWNVLVGVEMSMKEHLWIWISFNISYFPFQKCCTHFVIPSLKPRNAFFLFKGPARNDHWGYTPTLFYLPPSKCINSMVLRGGGDWYVCISKTHPEQRLITSKESNYICEIDPF